MGSKDGLQLNLPVIGVCMFSGGVWVFPRPTLMLELMWLKLGSLPQAQGSVLDARPGLEALSMSSGLHKRTLFSIGWFVSLWWTWH